MFVSPGSTGTLAICGSPSIYGMISSGFHYIHALSFCSKTHPHYKISLENRSGSNPEYYKEENRSNEPLVDVHYEMDFEDMIDWQYDDTKPSEMLGKSNDIKDYPEMLELEDEVIFWYGLV